MTIQRGRDVYLLDCEGVLTKKMNPKKRRRTSYIQSEASEASEPETEPETEEVETDDEEEFEDPSDSRKRKRYRREHR